MSLLKNIYNRFTRQASGNVAATTRESMPKAVNGALFVRIENYLHESKRYLDKDISRTTLAGELKTNENYLAKAIRKGAGMTVNEYINSLRIAYACALLSDPAGNTRIAKIAAESGFNNRISFYRSFVGKYGISPGEYRKLAPKTGAGGRKWIKKIKLITRN